MEVWGLQNTSVQNVLGDKFNTGMNAYAKAAGWMNWAFVITLVLTAVEFVVGFFAIFSRWGSLVTTVVSTVRFSRSPSQESSTNTLRGTNHLRPRGRRNSNSYLQCTHWRLQDRIGTLQHRLFNGQPHARRPLARRRLQRRFRLFLARQRVLLQRQEQPQEDGGGEDSVHIREGRFPGFWRSAGTQDAAVAE
jgi:hypothetical protein